MPGNRIDHHPILPIPERDPVVFYWQGQKLIAQENETIASALFANGIRIFGHHHRDGAPQGIFCANGQCAQCLVLANGKPVKSCMELVQPGVQVQPADGLPELPQAADLPAMSEVGRLEVPVLIIGGGPAGLSAAIELGKRGVDVLLIDDKHSLGGKLVLQTHRFFGSSQAVYAGTRGIDISCRLESELSQYPSVQVWLQSTALAVFKDQQVGIYRNGHEYVLVKPQVLLVASGAREKFLAFSGNALPGVYGAGAFQTLVNRDLVRPAKQLFIVGGGNVGLIAGYHALQAGIGVVGLVEALPECGGYKVHKDKLVRMGVPIYTSHTIVSANGTDYVESVTIAQVDEKFQSIPGTVRTFECDSVLIAVGLDPVDEFYQKAVEYGMTAFVAGDAEEIAEASAAIFSGKIRGVEIARALGICDEEAPDSWYRTGEILISKPGKNFTETLPAAAQGVIPVLHCTQEIPCNPCATLCPNDLIFIDETDIRSVPTYLGDPESCKACERCVAGCPGLAITLVNYRRDPAMPVVAIPYEFNRETIKAKDWVLAVDTTGIVLAEVEVRNVHSIKTSDRTLIVHVQAPQEIATRIAGIRVQDPAITEALEAPVTRMTDDTIICRCERVTAGEVRALIRQGYRDLNEIKAVARAGMGACGSKTCGSLIYRLFREEGVDLQSVTGGTQRPLFVEVPLGAFAGIQGEESHQ